MVTSLDEALAGARTSPRAELTLLRPDNDLEKMGGGVRRQGRWMASRRAIAAAGCATRSQRAGCLRHGETCSMHVESHIV